MTAAIIPMKWPDDDRYNGSLEHCACCGKPLRGKRRWVEVIDGGSSVAAPGLNPDPNDPGYMAFYPVGPSCARKHFPGFTYPDFSQSISETDPV